MEELTKGWLLALLEHASLDEAPGILAPDLPRDGPRLCEAVVRALATDADPRRIEPDGQLEALVARTGELAGAQTPEAAVRAVDTLEAGIIARDIGRAGAQALAARTLGSVRMAQAWRGAPLKVSIGVAVLGEDGSASEELIESAERAMLAAAAAGVGVHEGRLRGEPSQGGNGPRAS